MNRFGGIDHQYWLAMWMLLVGEIAGRPCTPSMASTVPTYRFGRFEVRLAQRRLLVDGVDARLGVRNFDMLVALIERRDRVVSGDEQFDLVWPSLVVEENNLRQQVAALRKLLGGEAIVTVPGRGYRFALALDTDEASAPAPSATAPTERTSVVNNLPLNLPALIGREPELATVVELLASTRLLTLVGAGGIGETRFALELADTVRGAYKDGVWLVELAPVADPSLVPRVVASVLAVHEEPAAREYEPGRRNNPGSRMAADLCSTRRARNLQGRESNEQDHATDVCGGPRRERSRIWSRRVSHLRHPDSGAESSCIGEVDDRLVDLAGAGASRNRKIDDRMVDGSTREGGRALRLTKASRQRDSQPGIAGLGDGG